MKHSYARAPANLSLLSFEGRLALDAPYTAILASEMSSAWSETGTVAAGVVLTMRAIDQEATEAAEARDFIRDLRKPTASDPRDQSAGTRAGCLYALAIPTVLLLSLLFGGGFESIGLPFLAGFAAMPAVIAVVLLTRFWRGHTVRALRLRERGFELLVTPSRLLLRADGDTRYEIPTTAISRFVGGDRLAIERTAGGLDVLALRFADRDHDALAARLNELLREARALGGGYRGVVAEVDEPSVAEALRRRG